MTIAIIALRTELRRAIPNIPRLSTGTFLFLS